MSEDVFDQLFAPALPSGLFLGVAVGVVTNTNDPDRLGRVKLALPWLSDGAETDWARVASPMAGKGRGLLLRPEVDDEVLVAFEHGSLQTPYVLGALWNGKDEPPATDDGDRNDVRVLRSRSGHVLRFDDTDGAANVELAGSGGTCRIMLDAASGTVTITSDADLVLESRQGKIVLKGAEVEISAQQGAAVHGSTVEVTASTVLTLRGNQAVNIN